MPTLNIGLMAYHAVGNLVFVRVPSERGRYLLTDMCVIAVACPQCGAVIGEPCRAGKHAWGSKDTTLPPNAHGCGVHVARKIEADKRLGRGWKRKVEHRLHLSAVDVAAAMAPAWDVEGEDAPFEVDVAVTRRE